ELLEGFYVNCHDGTLGSRNSGARGRTRTGTPVKASGPKPGASTNFATRASGSERLGPGISTHPRLSGESRIVSCEPGRSWGSSRFPGGGSDGFVERRLGRPEVVRFALAETMLAPRWTRACCCGSIPHPPRRQQAPGRGE